MRKRLLGITFFIVILFFMEMSIFAQGTSGLYTPVDGAAGLAQGNAFTARADDPSAIHFNPAGLTQLQRPQISLGASFVLPVVEYHGQGVNENMDTNINTVPNLYFASPIIKDKLAAGLGVTVPYGLRGKWDDDGFSRFVISDFNLRIININPGIAFKPLPFLSVGAGLDYYYAESDQNKHINVAMVNSTLTGIPIDNSAPEGFQEGNMHGDAFGYNAGILWNITPHHSIGISFRSKADIDYEGETRFSDLSGATATLFDGENFTSRTTTSATLPEMLSIGYAYRQGDLWSIETDVQWTNWSRLDVLTYNFEPTNTVLEANKEGVRNWHNTLSCALGGEYKLNEALKIRGGYSFHETPVPGDTFEPSVPQGSRHGVFTGFGYRWGKNLNKGFDFAYGVVIGEDRNVNNSVGDSVQGPIDGQYDSIIHVMAINFNYSF